MNSKEYLMQVKKLDCMIKNKQDELEKLKCLTVGGCNYGEEYIKSSPDPHSRENLLIKIIEFRKDLENDITRMIDLRKEVVGVIDKLDNADEIDILYKRYIQFMSWEQIAVDMKLGIRQVYRIHGQALLNIKGFLEKMK